MRSAVRILERRLRRVQVQAGMHARATLLCAGLSFMALFTALFTALFMALFTALLTALCVVWVPCNDLRL